MEATRLDTFKRQVSRGSESVPSGEVARRMNVPQNMMSAHFAYLYRARLIMEERHSRSVICRANLSEPIRKVIVHERALVSSAFEHEADHGEAH